MTSAWLVFAFLADWMLHVPSGVRWVHLIVLIALPCIFLWRELLTYLKRRPDHEGLAILLERAHPQLAQIVVSAIQLRNTPTDDKGHELVRRIVDDAEASIEGIDLEPVLVTKPPMKRFGIGALATLFAMVIFMTNGQAASIFFARLVGQDVAWPQETHLAIEIPMSAEQAQITIDGDQIHVRTARGNDIPVIVRAEGVVPDTVSVHFEGGQISQLSASGNSVFRTLLRSCQEDLSFYVTGGDDVDEAPRVFIEVLQPPDITGVAIRVQPPEYSKLPETIAYDADVEVLAGSAVQVFMRSDPEEASGIARLLPEDREIELAAANWPTEDPAAETLSARTFQLNPERTLRYRFELRDETGLQNPDPGLFAINVIEDRIPEVEVLAPGRTDMETVLGGAIPLRIRVSDDFGIAKLTWSSETRMNEGSELQQGELPWSLVSLQASGTTRSRIRERALASKLVEVQELSPTGQVSEGQLFTLEVSAEDTAQPQVGRGKSIPIRIRIVSADEFLRRLQDRLARARLDASELLTLQAEKNLRTRELLAALESDEVEAGRDSGGLNSALTGQRRVTGDSAALVRSLAGITQALLYSRIDERADALLGHLHDELSQHADKSFHAESWISLVELEARTSRNSGLGGKLVEVLGVAIEASEVHSLAATEALQRATDASTIEEVHDALGAAEAAQRSMLSGIETLLERLAEWDNFQSVLALTKDILNRQKNLLERTRLYEKEQ